MVPTVTTLEKNERTDRAKYVNFEVGLNDGPFGAKRGRMVQRA